MDNSTEQFRIVREALTDHEKRIRWLEKWCNYTIGFAGAIVLIWKLFSGR
jgi:hypothetical protein